MSYHNHDPEEKGKRANTSAAEWDKDDTKHTVEMLNRLSDYNMTEKQTKMIRHILEKVPQENKEKIMTNYVSSLIGSAILHYDKKYVQKSKDIKVSPWD